MKKQKKYFKSPYLKGNEEYLHNEFSKKVPLDGLLEGDKNLSSTATSRRDFLKFLGFSTAAAVLSASTFAAPLQAKFGIGVEATNFSILGERQ